MSIEDSCKQLSDLGEYTIQKTANFLFRQAGIKSPEKIHNALATAKEIVRNKLAN